MSLSFIWAVITVALTCATVAEAGYSGLEVRVGDHWYDPMAEIYNPERVLEEYALYDNADFALEPIPSTAESCEKCTNFFEEVMYSLYDNATLSEIEEVLDLACFLVPLENQKQCRAFVASLVQSLKSTDKSLIEDYTPYQFCGAMSLCDTTCCTTPYWPTGIHLSVTEDPSSVWIIWTTQLEGATPTVQYGLAEDDLDQSTVGTSTTYWQGGWNGYIYRVQLTELTPDTEYFYLVGDPTWEWCHNTYSFFTAPSPAPDGSGEVSIAIYGDMGNTDVSDGNVFWLTEAAMMHSIDLVLHAGDISYADGYQPGWDAFLAKVEPYAARIPYMTTAGNHETFYNFAAYRYRFQMPVDNLGPDVNRFNLDLYYSFNYGNVHVVAVSMEELFGVAMDMHPGGAQYEWLQADLEQANANREQQPWIIVYAHRPLYCSCDDTKRCVDQAAYYRSLIEELLYQYDVDIFVGAHIHNYERSLPVYNNTVMNPGGSSTYFENPEAPIYVVAGTGGDKEGLRRSYVDPAPSWSVESSRIAEWGYALITTNGGQSLQWDFMSARNNTSLDSFTITKS